MITSGTPVNLLRPGITDTVPTRGLDTFTASLVKPIDSLTKLGLSTSDVADTLDRMLRGGASAFRPATSDNAIVGSARLGQFSPGQTPSGSRVVREEHCHFGQINIDARDKPVSVVVDELKAEVRKRARQITGDSMRVVDAFQRG